MARKPTPTRLKILRGVGRKNPSRINREEPEPEAINKPPRAPGWLDGEAKRKWREATKHLVEMDIMTTADCDLLAVYCQAWSDMLKAQAAVAKTGQALVSKDKHGNVVVIRNPFAIQLHQLVDKIAKLGSEFGFSPSSRTRIKVNTKKLTGIKPRTRHKA